MKNRFLFSLLFLIANASVLAQRCDNYPCVIAKVKKALLVKDYKTAFDNLESADGYADKNTGEISDLRKKIFIAIEKEKERANTSAEVAKAEQAKTQAVLQQVDSLYKIAEVQRQKAERVLDRIYFYQGQFGLAYDKENYHYGFIDKNLVCKIAFQYEEALPFDYTGYARVKRNNIYYLIDTAGLEYPLATETNQLDDEITALDLRNQGLDTLPSCIFNFPQLNILLLGGNKIERLPRQIGELTNLQTLVLNNNLISELPREISQLTRLQCLDISDNELLQISKELASLGNLRTLDISGNLLFSLPKEIENLGSLYTLNLNNNQLRQLPEEIGGLHNLQWMGLSYNQIQNLPPGIGNLINLRRLDLFNNRLKQLPKEIGQLSNLQELDLFGNNLQALPLEIGYLKSLRFLNLGVNKILQLPEEIGFLTDLETLIAIKNNLNYLPAKIGNLNNLRSLNLAENRITVLPEALGGLTNLRQLNLSGNQLRGIPAEMYKLSQIEDFNVSGNDLTELPLEICRLHDIPKFDFSGNPDLKNVPPCLERFKKTEDLLNVLQNKINSCQDTIKLFELYGRLIQEQEKRFSTAASDALRLQVAKTYSIRAWYGLLLQNFTEAEMSARRGMILSSEVPSLKLNLAHAVLFQNRMPEAKSIYLDFADDAPANKTLIIKDFHDLKKAGIENPDTARILTELK